MKYSILFKSFLFTILLTVFWGCDLFNGDDPKPADKYLAEFEKHATYLPETIKSVLTPLVTFYPDLQIISDNAKHTVDVYNIKYFTNFKGKQIVASGLVALPTTPGKFPVLSYQRGTSTLHSEAPTMSPDNDLYKMLEFFASSGFIVCIPDYIGFGYSSTQFHPYLDKESTVQSIVDMIRAVKELAGHYENTELNDDLYITGYSQGGWATMVLQKAIEDNYSTEFNLKASSCGAGPYDLNLINEYVVTQTSYPMPYYIGYIFNSYINLGDVSVTAGDVFKSPYDQRVMTLFDGKHSGGDINAQLTKVTADLFTIEYKNGYKTNIKYSSVISALSKNSIPAWKTNITTLITHGAADTYVPVQISDKMYNDFMALGVDPSKVKYTKIPGADHGSAALPSSAATFSWFISLNKAN